MGEHTAGIAKDPLAVDMRVSLLAAALLSYRHDTVLRPFPPMFIGSNKVKDYAALKQMLTSLKLVKTLTASQLSVIDHQFLAWITDSNNISLQTCEKETFEKIKNITGHTVHVPPPNYIFKVLYSDQSEAKFRESQKSYDIFYAYHGSKTENFHSILHYGLNSHMCKNALFGEGTYLTSELSVAMTFCPTGQAWENSMLGTKLGCIAVCEVINHPSVNCQQKHPENNGQSRARIAGSMGGDIPEKYYVVRNNDLLRMKYILVYTQKTASFRQSWIFKHRFALMMIAYVILLLMVAIFANKDLHRHLKRFWK